MEEGFLNDVGSEQTGAEEECVWTLTIFTGGFELMRVGNNVGNKRREPMGRSSGRRRRFLLPPRFHRDAVLRVRHICG
ncbi:hypothetical protein ACHAXS_002215 [Conticribra weissflogii]